MSTYLDDHLNPKGRSDAEPTLMPSVKDSEGNDVLFNSAKRRTTQATVVDLGSSPNANDGDPLRTAFGKINNFIEAEYWVNESINQKFRAIDSDLRSGVKIYGDVDSDTANWDSDRNQYRYSVSLIDNSGIHFNGTNGQIEVSISRMHSANNPHDFDSEVRIKFQLAHTVEAQNLNVNELFSIIDSDGVERVTYKTFDYPTTYNERVQNGIDAEFNIGTNVVLGRDSDDVLVVNSRIASNLIPYGDEIYNLGDSDNKWRDLFLSGNTIFLGSIQIKNYNNRGLVLVDSDGKTLDLTIGDGRANSLQVDSDLLVDGIAQLLGELSVKQFASFDSDVSVNGNLYVGDDVAIDGKVSIRESLTVDSDVVLSADLRVDSDAIIKGQLTVGLEAKLYGGISLYDSENQVRCVWDENHSTLSILNKDGTAAFAFNADNGQMTGNGTIDCGTF